MHIFNNNKLSYNSVLMFPFNQECGYYTDDLAFFFKHSICKRTHKSFASASVDEGDLFSCEYASKSYRVFTIKTVVTILRTAKHCNRPYLHTICLSFQN